MNLEQFKTTKDKVRGIMNEHPYAKDSDNYLIGVYINLYFDEGLDDVKYSEVLAHRVAGLLPSDDTITRARRQLNQLEPDTRGEYYKGRKENETVITQNINKI